MTFASYPSLRGKCVFITGGASGIGADLVRAFYQQQACVGFVDVQDEAAAALQIECNNQLWYQHCDITDISALQVALTAFADAQGSVLILINNAADDTRIPVDTITPVIWDDSLAVNLRPHFFAAQAVRAGMQAAGGGAIINLSSIAWHLGIEDLAPYASAKAAIVGLTFSLARAFGGDNIRVNAIEPGAVMTARQRALWYPSEAEVAAMVDRQAIKRVLLGEEIARMALFLASDDARMISKQSFRIDAGLS